MRETSFLLVARGDAACPTFRTCPGMGHVVANFLLVVSRKLLGWKPLLLGARKLLGAPGLTKSKQILVTKGIASRSKDAIRNKGHF